MIVFVRELQALRCEECEELEEVQRKVVRDPEQMLNALEAMREEHKACLEFRGDPERAKLERGYRQRMRCELQRQRK